jgi:hypothetical protein
MYPKPAAGPFSRSGIFNLSLPRTLFDVQIVKRNATNAIVPHAQMPWFIIGRKDCAFRFPTFASRVQRLTPCSDAGERRTN